MTPSGESVAAEADRRWKAGEDLEAIAEALGVRPKEVYFLLRTSMTQRQRRPDVVPCVDAEGRTVAYMPGVLEKLGEELRAREVDQ